MGRMSTWRTITTAFTVAAIVYAIRTKQPEGTFLKVPYDFRMPTLHRLRERFWNPDDPRIFIPHFFGVGWSLNLYQLRRTASNRPTTGRPSCHPLEGPVTADPRP